MYHGDSRPQDLATGAAMTALYRQLDNQDLPDDPGFDIEAGLRDLTSRIQRERSRQPAQASKDRELLLTAATAGIQGCEPAVLAEDPVQLAAIGHGRDMVMSNARTGLFTFAGITATALATIALIIFTHSVSTAAVTALTVINAITATAGTLIQRTGTLALRAVVTVRSRTQDRAAGPPGYTPPAGPAPTGTQDPVTPSGGTHIHIDHFRGNLEVSDPPPVGGRQSARPHHRVIDAILAVLIIAATAAAAVGIVGMLAQGPPTAYEITLITPAAISIILLLTSWWWRTTDQSPPAARRPRYGPGSPVSFGGGSRITGSRKNRTDTD